MSEEREYQEREHDKIIYHGPNEERIGLSAFRWVKAGNPSAAVLQCPCS